MRSKYLPNLLITNVQSIASKVDDFECVLKLNNIDIACVTETWLNKDISSELIDIPDYAVYRHDRSDGRQGGGVACYVRHNVSCLHLKELECSDVESLWLLFRAPRMPRLVSHVLIGTIYHPPTADGQQTVNHIVDCLDKMIQKHPNAGIVLTGDFNQLRDRAILSYPLKQVVKRATRGTNILDKIYTNIDKYYTVPHILSPVGRSDHNVVAWQAKLRLISINNVDTFSVVRSHDSNGKKLLAEALRTFNWTRLYRMEDCELMLSYFYDIVRNRLDSFLPLRISRRQSADKPWIDENFRYLIKLRQKAWNNGNVTEYRSLRNKVQRETGKLKSRYYNRCVRSLRQSGAKNWWRGVKKLTGQSTQCPLNTMADNLCNGKKSDLANDINKFFYSVSADLDALDPDMAPDAPDVCPEEFIIEPYEVERKLSSINVHKSSGPDDLPNWIWRDFSPWLAEPICAIFNASIRNGVVPVQWKSANVVPVPKVKPPKSIESDLRPISLTATLSKILESFIGNWILCELNGKLDTRQYGILKGRSTTHELVDLLHHWHDALDNNASVRAVFIDYAKAFDHVDHTIIINKLHAFGISTILIRWMYSFLSNRQQRVKLSDIFSDWLTLKGSMPQGSFLGPLTFLILIDDLTASCRLYKFVDDTTLCEFIEQYATTFMKNYLDEVIDWSSKNLMNINWKKTKEMILGPLSREYVPELIIGGNNIERVEVFKLLGVYIEDSLNWNSHVDSICSKASSRLHFLNRLKRSGVSSDDLLLFYTSVIRSVLEYACQAWHTSLTVEQTHRIESIQKRALAIIFGHDNIIIKANFPTLESRREELCKLFSRDMYNANNCLNYLLPKPRDCNAINKLRHFNRYIAPTARTVRYQKSFIMHALEHYQQPIIS